MKTTVRWAGDASFVAESGSGHEITMDGPADSGGQDKGPRPMEMLLMGMGGCTSFDVVLILRKSRQDIRGCVAEITAERAPSDPKVFTRIHVHFVVTGKDLDLKRVQKAVNLSEEKYCSASIMLGKTAQITHDIEIVNVD